MCAGAKTLQNEQQNNLNAGGRRLLLLLSGMRITSFLYLPDATGRASRRGPAGATLPRASATAPKRPRRLAPRHGIFRQENHQRNFDTLFDTLLPPGVASSRSICERAKKIPNSKTETPRAPISFPQPIPHQKRNHCGAKPLQRRRSETWRRKIMNRLTRI